MKTLRRVLETVSKNFHIPFSVADLNQPDEPLIYVNKAFEELSGYEATEVIGRNCRFLQSGETNKVTREAIRTAINERKSFWADLLNTKRDGTKFWNRLVLIPFGYNEDTIQVYIGIQIEVTSDIAVVESRFNQERSDIILKEVAKPFKNIVDIRRSIKYLQFCEDDNEFEEKLNELTDQMSQEVNTIVTFLRENAQSELRSQGLIPS